MAIASPLIARWQRALSIDRAAIKPVAPGWYLVPSSKAPATYAVEIVLDAEGRLSGASCTCPDFERVTPTAPPTLHGVRICKHVLAACLKAKEVH